MWLHVYHLYTHCAVHNSNDKLLQHFIMFCSTATHQLQPVIALASSFFFLTVSSFVLTSDQSVGREPKRPLLMCIYFLPPFHPIRCCFSSHVCLVSQERHSQQASVWFALFPSLCVSGTHKNVCFRLGNGGAVPAASTWAGASTGRQQ